ncbi:MAG: hypothetical protein DWQ47_14465 [Acidobacteria bacterium]|nr:MAG: hypothetical protein DWQ32_01865 [Acidobacteriota bacterium]REK02728.1 MAG: hypothetical protein DWQ38_10270 [Acidobacteriota bacterium]REK13467.1 MAG: hypothetical protein DWQ43_07555 [Acidobacteriota bacterium]REK41461.1 MAG: hypothetical protein DWQ47_14465 [Acidobacteriota bacterium]
MNSNSKNLIAAFTLSGLCLFTSWNLILAPSYYGEARAAINALAILFDVLLLAACFYFGHLLLFRRGGKAGRITVYVIFLFAARIGLRNLYKNFFGALSLNNLSELVGRPLAVALTVAAALAVVAAVYIWRTKLFLALRAVFIILFPFVAILFVQTIIFAVRAPLYPQPHARSTDVEVPSMLGRRVVWIIFDELDHQYLFRDRPDSADYPEFESLARASLSAEHAYPPSQRTMTSIPALTTGRIVEASDPVGDSDLRLSFSDPQGAALWSDDNVFRSVKTMGGTVAIVGWYHPYCRVFAGSYDLCFTDMSFSHNIVLRPHPDGFLESAIDYFVRLGATLPVLEDLVDQDEEYIEVSESTVRESLGTLDQGRADLTFLHLPMPHPPFIFKRENGQIDPNATGNYFDAIKYADNVLGEIRQTMTENGTWDNSFVIVSSDHAFRKDDLKAKHEWSALEKEQIDKASEFRIPFIFKSANGTTPVQFTNEFNTLITRDLVMAILNGEISTNEEAAKWIEGRETPGRLDQ